MAESVVKLRVENSEYDAKIKRAAQGLQHMEEACRKVGGTLAVLDKEEKQFVQSLGRMETVSRDARGRIGELTKAFVDLSTQYNRLTEEEKKGDYGKALSASLEQIKTRINDAKGELNKINAEIGNNGSLLEQLAGKYGLNIEQVGKLGIALGAATAATKVASDAFFANEQNLDEWGRVTSSCESLYKGFLNSLNTGDISGFLSNINSIIKAARDAYDALDELATYNAFNQIQVEKARAGMTSAQADYREGKGSKEDVKKASDQLVKELSDRQKKEKEAYEAAVRDLATKRGVNGTALLNALSGSYGSYEQLKKTKMTGSETRYTPGGMFGGSTAYQVAVPANDRERMGQALRQINDTELQALQALGAQAQRTQLEIEQTRKQTARVLGAEIGRGGGGGKGSAVTKEELSGPLVDLENKLKELQKAQHQAASPEAWNDYGKQIVDVQKQIDDFKGKLEPLRKDEQATYTLTVDKSQLEALKKELPEDARIIENEDRITITADTANVDKAVNDVLKLYDGAKREVEKKPVEMQVGVSGLSTEAFTAYIKMLQEQMKTADLTSPLYQNLQQNLADTNILQNILKTALQNGIDLTTIDAEGLWDQIISGEDIPDEAWQGLADEINAKLAELGIEPIKIDFQTGDVKTDKLKKEGDATAEAWKTASQAVGSIGSALSQIEDPTAKVLGIISEAIANVALGFANSLKDGKMTGGPWGWIAAAATGTATMLSTIGAIKSATAEYHAQGGIVGQSGPFVPKGTDTIPAMLTPGEVVLSHAQTSNLANTLQGGGMNNMHLETTIHGEDLRIMLNNNSRRRGRGEYVTSR